VARTECRGEHPGRHRYKTNHGRVRLPSPAKNVNDSQWDGVLASDRVVERKQRWVETKRLRHGQHICLRHRYLTTGTPREVPAVLGARAARAAVGALSGQPGTDALALPLQGGEEGDRSASPGAPNTRRALAKCSRAQRGRLSAVPPTAPLESDDRNAVAGPVGASTQPAEVKSATARQPLCGAQ
jgi:hypothetical protein